MKKPIKVLIMGVLSAAILAGCGNNTPSNTEALDPVPTAIADTIVSEAPMTTVDITASEAPTENVVNTEAQNTEGVYRVHVTDILGKPVAGVKVQFCSDDLCTLGTTDNDGYAVFDQPEGQTYETHLFKVPQGYVKDESVYQVPDKYTTVEIKLQASER